MTTGMKSGNNSADWAFPILDNFEIEIPSWGFANTGTRFGKFVQAAAASTIEEKFSDAAEVNRLTGSTPTMALHVLWDLPNGLDDVDKVRALEQSTAIRSGSINPNLFQDQEYKFGSLCNPDPDIRAHAVAHMIDPPQKITMPITMTRLRPNSSPTIPKPSMAPANVSAYAPTTHCSDETPACNCCWMLPSATLTTVLSRNVRNKMTHNTARARERPPRVAIATSPSDTRTGLATC